MSSSGIINIIVPRKNTNPGKSNFNEAGYIELKMNAPIKLHKVSSDAVAENRAPENSKEMTVNFGMVETYYSVSATRFLKKTSEFFQHESNL